jgi:hypothetical protein
MMKPLLVGLLAFVLSVAFAADAGAARRVRVVVRGPLVIKVRAVNVAPVAATHAHGR